MIIRRNVYLSAIDEQTGEERLYSTTELIDEESYLNEMMYSEKDNEEKEFSEKKKLSLSDKISLASVKLTPKKSCEDQADYWRSDEEKSKKAGNKLAKKAAVTTGTLGTIAGGLNGHLAKGKKGAIVSSIAGAAIGAGAGYGSSKAGEAISRKLRKKNDKYRKMAEKTSDQYAVGAKRMTKDEYREKYGK